MSNYVMGDIHGGYLALEQCLERCKFDYQNDTLIQLGDIIDGNRPDWILCMKELQKIKNLILIKGNHDQWLREYLETGVAKQIWLSQGGQCTLDVYLKGLDDGIITEDEVRAFFNKQVRYYLDDDNRLFVHGGIKYGHKTDIAMELMWNRDMWESAVLGYQQMKTKNYKEIFIGHTSTLYFNEELPMNKFNIWNLDTGAGGGGRLTIMNVDTKKYWQSDNLQELYPHITKFR